MFPLPALPAPRFPATFLALLTVLALLPRAGRAASSDWITLSTDRSHFVQGDSGATFRPWGVNYDHRDRDGALLEDYWAADWEEVVADFDEIAALGANVVRIHLQLAKFMADPESPDPANLKRLQTLLTLATRKGFHLNLTGLGCYHRHDVPAWYDALPESARWDVQARFWEAIAHTCAASPAVFCYDLMNEPVLPGKEAETEWLTGELGGKHFVQRLTLDLRGRSREEVAQAWVARMAAAIRKHDKRHLLTVGVIPWNLIWPQAKPLFYSEPAGAPLDFVSIHLYPRHGEMEAALTALRAYDLGKPLVVEEIFPLHCSAAELETFLAEASRQGIDGWFSFYWGTTPAEYDANPDRGLAESLKAGWIRRFATLSPTYRAAP